MASQYNNVQHVALTDNSSCLLVNISSSLHQTGLVNKEKNKDVHVSDEVKSKIKVFVPENTLKNDNTALQALAKFIDEESVIPNASTKSAKNVLIKLLREPGLQTFLEKLLQF